MVVIIVYAACAKHVIENKRYSIAYFDRITTALETLYSVKGGAQTHV